MHSAPNTFTPERREVFFQVLEDTCSPKQAPSEERRALTELLAKYEASKEQRDGQ